MDSKISQNKETGDGVHFFSKKLAQAFNLTKIKKITTSSMLSGGFVKSFSTVFVKESLLATKQLLFGQNHILLFFEWIYKSYITYVDCS